MLKNTKKKKTKVQEEIGLVHEKLRSLDIGTEEYETTLKQLGFLYEIEDKRKWRVSPDTAAVVACNLVGIMLVMKQEEFNVITSKAFSFIMRGRA